ncbi:MAG: hypothetical protein IJD78_01010 [Clostridia bacterium]|nr:hypothetical protein [Clostridia bacterium]
MDNFTIIVNSCDKYEDAWDPFFRLMEINWPESENYKIILNTETKDYKCNYRNVKTVCSGNIAWSKRLKNILETVDTDFVLFFLEDFFLRSPVNQKMFEEAYNLISENEDIGYIGLKYSPERIFKDKNYTPTERFFSRDLLATKFRITAMSVLWRRTWLIELLDEKENPWEFENNASVRSRQYPYKVLEINNINGVCPPVFDFEDKIKYGYGITHGQWLPKNKELFEKFGIEVNFDNLGINYQLYEEANNPPKKHKKQKPENFVEFLYEIKKSIFGKKQS